MLISCADRKLSTVQAIHYFLCVLRLGGNVTKLCETEKSTDGQENFINFAYLGLRILVKNGYSTIKFPTEVKCYLLALKAN